MDSNILLLSCYELGHQPLSLAWPLAALAEAGFEAAGVDLSVDVFPHELAAQANFVGIAVPMHTAMRLGVQVALRLREINPHAHISFYGLYAWMNKAYLFEEQLADSVIAGEYETPLTALVAALAEGAAPEDVPGIATPEKTAVPYLDRQLLPVPIRQGLPPLSQYARFTKDGIAYLAGYTEASRGCLQACRHCPVVPVYNGRFFVVPVDTVMADIRQQIAAGAGHITFGDPDFLNGPGHALKIAQALHAEFPWVTFDFTAKVEHLLKHQRLLPELRDLGAAFVISAFESINEEVLARLEKGHKAADMDAVLQLLSEVGLPVHPTWMPFTPWTSLPDYLAFLAWIRSRDLVFHTAPVQLSIRMLVPPHSALLNQPGTGEWLGGLDASNYSYQWVHPDSRMDMLQQEVAALVEYMADDPAHEVFAAIEDAAYTLAGEAPEPWPLLVGVPPELPRLTEDWFC